MIFERGVCQLKVTIKSLFGVVTKVLSITRKHIHNGHFKLMHTDFLLNNSELLLRKDIRICQGHICKNHLLIKADIGHIRVLFHRSLKLVSSSCFLFPPPYRFLSRTTMNQVSRQPWKGSLSSTSRRRTIASPRPPLAMSPSTKARQVVIALVVVLSLLLFFPKCGPTRLGILQIECGRVCLVVLDCFLLNAIREQSFRVSNAFNP